MSAATGAARKAAAFRNLEANREALIVQARRALVRHLLEHGTGTLDDVRADLDLGGLNPTALGAVPGPLARRRIIARGGYRASSRPEARARIVATWTLLDRDAALRWLQEHPGPEPAPETGGQLALPLGGG